MYYQLIRLRWGFFFFLFLSQISFLFLLFVFGFHSFSNLCHFFSRRRRDRHPLPQLQATRSEPPNVLLCPLPLHLCAALGWDSNWHASRNTSQHPYLGPRAGAAAAAATPFKWESSRSEDVVIDRSSPGDDGETIEHRRYHRWRGR